MTPLTPASPEPSEGSVVLTNSATGTAWQRFYSDSKWHSTTGAVSEFPDLFINSKGQPCAVLLLHDTKGE